MTRSTQLLQEGLLFISALVYYIEELKLGQTDHRHLALQVIKDCCTTLKGRLYDNNKMIIMNE